MLIVLAANVEHSNVLLALVFMLVAAKVLAEVFKRLRQPAIVSKISAGVLFGRCRRHCSRNDDWLRIG